MQILKNHVLEREQNKPILIDAFYHKDKIKQPIVIFCHGYKGFKDWGAWDLMAKQMAKAGFCFVKFNFSHNGGTIENPIDFPNLEAFGQNNYSKELDDLNDVISWSQHYFKDDLFVNIHNICLIGHSRGGGIATIKAEEDSRIKNCITLAGVSDFKVRFNEGTNEFKAWKQTGVKFIENGRTKQQMPHYFQFYEDFILNENRLTIKRAVSNLKIPQLIIHGNDDASVSVEEAKLLHRWNPNSILKIIEGADHVFNTKHPWDVKKLSPELEIVVKLITAF